MRLESRVSAATRIEVLTEGVLTRRLQEDPGLDGVGCVIFDEYHERSLQADLGLALSLDARRQLKAPFRVLVLSATLDGSLLVRLLGDAARVQVTAAGHAVSLRYLGRAAPPLPQGDSAGAEDAQRLAQAVLRAVRQALEETAGDVLVFLPGVGEIRRAEAALSVAALPGRTQVMPLYGQMDGAAQCAVLAPGRPGERRLVLATNIAETSLTIPGVTAVIDSGLVRRSRFDPGTGMSRLELERISRASAEQRRGRAGRLGPGVCYRLWSEGAHQGLAPESAPQILDADLAGLALELARWGAHDALSLDWLDPPPPAMLGQARSLLAQLGALDAHGRLTALGAAMARLPAHPSLAAMLLAARESAAVGLAANLAALLSERDLLAGAAARAEPAVESRLALLRAGGRSANDPGLVERVRRQARALGAAGPGHPARPGPAHAAIETDAGMLLAQGYPDRIGQRRPGPPGRYLLASGRGAAFAAASSLARSDYIVAVAVEDRGRDARIDLAAPLARAAIERLFAHRITVEETCGWDHREEAVLWRRVRRLDALVLEEQVRPAPAGAPAIEAMLAGVRCLGLDALPWDRPSRLLQARLEFVRSLERADLAGWPASDDAGLLATLEQWLPRWLQGVSRREHLARLPLAQSLLGRLSVAQRRALGTLAPEQLALPSGASARIDYLGEHAPCVALRLQQAFGLTASPRIGAGAVAITFKLLSPAQRPLQVTRDLAGFWRGSYAAVRKEMRGRYPRHAWPEDPLLAPPAGGRTPRS